MVDRDDEIKVLGEINVELESGTHKLIEKLSKEKDSQEEALEEFTSTPDNVLEKLIQEKDSPYDFYCFMYDTDDDASISGKSSEHFGWDWPEKDSPGTEVDWQDDPLHESEDFFVGLDQSIQIVVAEEVMKMANGQAEAISDQEVADDCLDDEQVKERRPSKLIETSNMDVDGSETAGQLEELEQAAKSKIYARMWVLQMEMEVANDNQIARKLLDVVKDVDKSLKKGKELLTS
ncbi:hypothetical protein Tco_1276872 [Tanacetum coccineum]